MEYLGGCTRNGTCPLVPRRQIPVAPTLADPGGGCTRNGTCSLAPQNWRENASNLAQSGCTRNGTCPLVPRKQTQLGSTIADHGGGCTRNGTSLEPRNQNWYRNISDSVPQGGCTRNGTCPLVPRNNNRHVVSTNGGTGEGCTRNGTCPLVPRKKNHRVTSTNGDIGEGCTRNGTCPLVPRNQKWSRNISVIEPQGGCTRNETCPLVPGRWNMQNGARGTIFEGVSNGNGASPCSHAKPIGNFLSQKHNGGCTLNGTCPLVPLEQNWIMNDFQLDRNGTSTVIPQPDNWNIGATNMDNTYMCTRNGRCPLRPQNQNWHQNVEDLEPIGACTCPLLGNQYCYFEAGDTEPIGQCNRRILRPWKPPIHYWRLTASDMEVTNGCFINECPIIRCKQNCKVNTEATCCRGCAVKPMYLFKTHNQFWQLDARDMGLTEDCMPNEMLPTVPLQLHCHFDSLNATPCEGCNEICDKTVNHNLHYGNGFQHNEQCECTFCRVQYRPEYSTIVDQQIGEPQRGRNGQCSLARQKQGQCNGLDNTVPTEVCEVGNCYMPQNRRYNGRVPQTEAETCNGNTACTRTAHKQNWQNAQTKNEVFRCPGRGVYVAHPQKYYRANTEPAMLYQRYRTFGRGQKKRIISHNSTTDELFVQSHQY